MRFNPKATIDESQIENRTTRNNGWVDSQDQLYMVNRGKQAFSFRRSRNPSMTNRQAALRRRMKRYGSQ